MRSQCPLSCFRIVNTLLVVIHHVPYSIFLNSNLLHKLLISEKWQICCIFNSKENAIIFLTKSTENCECLEVPKLILSWCLYREYFLVNIPVNIFKKRVLFQKKNIFVTRLLIDKIFSTTWSNAFLPDHVLEP